MLKVRNGLAKELQNDLGTNYYFQEITGNVQWLRSSTHM
jgi:hypothetical protein